MNKTNQYLEKPCKIGKEYFQISKENNKIWHSVFNRIITLKHSADYARDTEIRKSTVGFVLIKLKILQLFGDQHD